MLVVFVILLLSCIRWRLTFSSCLHETALPPPSTWTFSSEDTATNLSETDKSALADPERLPDEVDVVVVGAGYAGLTTALELSRAGKRVVVLEAHGHVGGRTLNLDLSDIRPGAGYVEVGGEWLAHREDQPHAWWLIVDELNSSLIEWGLAPVAGDGFVFSNAFPQGMRYGTSLRGLWGLAKLALAHWLDIIDFWATFSLVDRLKSSLWANEALYAQLTLNDWLCQTVRAKDTRNFLKTNEIIIFSQEPQGISSLFALSMQSKGHWWKELNSAQTYRIKGGSSLPAKRLAAQLGDDIVQLSMPVTQIEQDSHGVSVTVEGHPSHRNIRAKYLVMTGSPRATSGIKFVPPLPVSKQQVLNFVQMGSQVKLQLIYESPWWRAAGLSGQSISNVDVLAHSESLLLTACLDNTPHGVADPVGVVVCFCAGECAFKMMRLSQAERAREFSAYLARQLGPRALKPIRYIDYNWMADQYAGGAYTIVVPPGGFTKHNYSSLRESFGRVHWAGSDYRPLESGEMGYINGAIHGGREVAASLLDSLNSGTATTGQ